MAIGRKTVRQKWKRFKKQLSPAARSMEQVILGKSNRKLAPGVYSLVAKPSQRLFRPEVFQF